MFVTQKVSLSHSSNYYKEKFEKCLNDEFSHAFIYQRNDFIAWRIKSKE